MNKKMIIKNAVINFANLAQPSTYNGKPSKYDITIRFNKDSKAGQVLETAVESILRDNNNPELLDQYEKLAFKDGNNSEYSVNHDHWVLKANSNTQVPCFDQLNVALSLDDIKNKIDRGATVNAVALLWYQDNEYGQRVNCIRQGVQLVKESTIAKQDPSSFFDEINLDNDSEEF